MATNNKDTSLISFVDNIFAVGGEMIEQNGEDSFSFSLNDKCGYIGVFDGCGGIGSRKYESFGDKTGAYIASHVCSDAMLDWFKRFCAEDIELSSNNIKYICDSVKECFVTELGKFEIGGGSATLKGSLTKSFPTTASLILFKQSPDGLFATYLWAGDSRGFVLTSSGLIQVTVDDIEVEGDAMENLSNDSKLTNMVCADGDFHFNNRVLTHVTKGVFLTASDGFFAYFSTPMEFEFMLIDTLCHSGNVTEWKARLEEYIKKYTADDYTLGVCVCGYKNFKNLKKEYASRHELLYKKYIAPLSGMSDQEKLALWNEYKKNYYRGE